MRRAAGIACALSLLACRGPDPHVVQQAARRLADGSALRVEAVVENRGHGSGQVAVTATVEDPASGAVVARETKEVDLEANERQPVVIEVELPTSRTPDEDQGLGVHVQAQYPVE
jgi:hypothetical protein